MFTCTVRFRDRLLSPLLLLLPFALPGVAAWAADLDEPLDLDRFEKTTVATNLVQPLELDIAPDGRIFLIELGGVVKLVDPPTGNVSEIAKLDVFTEQENGLIGLALDPNFAENQWVYLQYSRPDFSGQTISRFKFVDEKLDLRSEQRLFQYEEQRRECCHHAGSLEFGPDGNLYIGTGDNTNPFNDSQGYAPHDERPDREPWDAQRTAGNTKSYNGKVLRIRPKPDEAGYTIPEGNLFPSDGSIGYPEIYVMGCRNPWRINVDQRTGFLYWGDVGPDAGKDGARGPRGYDEVNQARQAGNHGWPYFIGNNRAYSMVDFATGEIGPAQDPEHPHNRSVNNTGAVDLPPARPPLLYYPAAPSDEFPEVGAGGRTACAGPVYYFDSQLKSDKRFPVAYDSTLFAFEWSRNWIMAVHLNQDGGVAWLEPFLPQFSFVRPVDMQFDSGGSLYVIEYGETWGVNADAKLVRLDYVRGNRSPIAVAQVENNIGREPLTVELDARASTDKDGDALSYRWRAIATSTGQQSVPDLGIDLGREAVVTATFEQPGVYTIELEVSDSNGAANVSTQPVIVGNARPVVEFLSPRNGDFYSPDKPIQYQLVIHDLEDGTSDFEEAEDGDLKAIDLTAPSRTFVKAEAVSAHNGLSNEPPGLTLMRHSDCFNCHATNRPLVGPMLIDIANKYRDQPHQVELSVNRVFQGSTGVWGKIAMLPHGQHSREQVQQMVEYVFSIPADSHDAGAQGLRNSILVPTDAQTLRLEASYTDLGRAEIPALTGACAITLRRRRLQAEAAEEFRGTQAMEADKAEQGKFMGGIEHDGYLRFSNIPFDQVASVTVSVASAGAGGQIELHQGAVDGPLLGKTAVVVNGDWLGFYEKSIELQPTDTRADLFLVFKNAEHRSGLMNIDWIEFK